MSIHRHAGFQQGDLEIVQVKPNTKGNEGLKGNLLLGQFPRDAVGDLHQVRSGKRPVQSLSSLWALLGVVVRDAEGGGVQLWVHESERWR